NKGKTRGLLDISGWQSMTLTQAAQKVQISAYPNAYAKWEKSATAWLSQLG
ncbi:MAG: LysM peptidoglycan-binding domain-containing protein, partial [Pseudolysinimonas sp.]